MMAALAMESLFGPPSDSIDIPAFIKAAADAVSNSQESDESWQHISEQCRYEELMLILEATRIKASQRCGFARFSDGCMEQPTFIRASFQKSRLYCGFAVSGDEICKIETQSPTPRSRRPRDWDDNITEQT